MFCKVWGETASSVNYDMICFTDPESLSFGPPNYMKFPLLT